MLVGKEKFLNHSHKKMEGDNQPDKLIYILGGTNITSFSLQPGQNETMRNYLILITTEYGRCEEKMLSLKGKVLSNLVVKPK